VPNLKKNPSALKCARRDARKTVYRGAVRTSSRTHVKKFRILLATNKVADAEQALGTAIKSLDKAAEKGVIHKNNAARRKSRLMRAMNKAKLAA
jgi:small subunit ribosomal protein S20